MKNDRKDPSYNLDKELLVKILDNTFMNIFVADSNGKIVFANQGSLDVLGISREDLIGMTCQELLDKNIIDHSITLDSLGKKESVVGEQRTIMGHNLLAISRPLLDDEDNIIYIMTNSSPDVSMHSFMKTLEKEHQNTQRYKNALTYILENNGHRNTMIVRSEIMQQLLVQMMPAIRSDCAILLYGESGTGKDVFANFIHTNSPRATEPFVPVNCGAIPQQLMESEFFGYESGAFTGASRKGHIGFFQMADKGTLFLDEIGELPLSMQSKLLRVLEDRMVTPIGGKKRVQVNIRIIAATNRDLSEMVREKAFREDLYYRLNVIPFTIPPLRERQDDILPMAKLFLERYSKHKLFAPEVEKALLEYSWRGNVRELKNIVERLSIMVSSDVITAEDLRLIGFDQAQHYEKTVPDTQEIQKAAFDAPEKEDGIFSVIEQYRTLERTTILNALVAAKGNKSKAAKALGISRGKLYKLLEK